MAYANPCKSAQILVAANPREDLSPLAGLLRDNGYLVQTAASWDSARESITQSKPGLLLLDLSIINSRSACLEIKENGLAKDMPVIILLSAEDADDGAQAIAGADCIPWPCREEDVLKSVADKLQTHSLRKELEESRRSLYYAQEMLRAALVSIDDGVIFTDDGSRIVQINDVAKNMTGWHQESAIGRPLKDVFQIKSEPLEKSVHALLQRVLETDRAAGSLNEAVLISREGIERPIAGSAAPMMGMDGKPAGMILVFRDVTSEKLHLHEIEFLSFHDHLTELHNRRFLEAELMRLDALDKLPLTLVMGDLNGLKMTNDAFGHFAGDDLLRKTAAILKSCFRLDDVISRYGGDEFVIILPNTTSQAAEAMVKKVLGKIKESRSGKGFLSISFGWDTKTEKSQSIAQILKNAEDYMYKRKLLESPSNRSAAINAIVKTLYEKNSREEAHSKRVSELSTAIGQAMGLPESEITKIQTAGLLHDIGKITISNEILEKRGPLTEAEWEDIRQHPETAFRILCGVPEMAELAEAVRQHHERWDGKGYPWGLKGEEITLAARIICVADAFDAMTSSRPYRDGMSFDTAREEIRLKAGTQFDPKIAEVFLKHIHLQ